MADPVYEIRDLHDGRVGIFRNGLAIAVCHDEDEVRRWFDARRQSGNGRAEQDLMLGRNLR